MEQLLEVKYVPILFEMKIHKAKLEVCSDYALHKSAIDNKYLTPYKSKLRFDTNEYRNINNKKKDALYTYKNYIPASVKTTANTVKEEDSVMSTKKNYDTLHDFAFKHADSSLKSAIGVPLLPINFNWNSEQLKNQYEIDRQSYDWITKNNSKLKFTPAKIEFLVKEYAHVEFKFLGKPQYVPPSASPDYKPPELDVSA